MSPVVAQNTQQNDEILLVICIVAGIAAMIVGIVMFQRRREARIARMERIEIPIYSIWRTVVVMFPGIAVVPVLVGVVGAVTDPWLRSHALGAVLVSVGGGGASLIAALAATRKFRTTGTLMLSSSHLQLDHGRERHMLDPKRPFRLFEAACIRPGTLPLQVILVTQDLRSWGFSYGLTPRRKPHGENHVDVPLAPLLGGETRILHDRLRAQPTMKPDQSNGPWRMGDGNWVLADGRWHRHD